MAKNILEVKVEENDGEFVIRVSGEQAANIIKSCGCLGMCCAPAGDKKAAASDCC
jgi:hypothetical protein